MTAPHAPATGVAVRVRGIVQGVGFRPTVWRLASECGLAGDVRNDGAGVLIRAFGGEPELDRFLRRLQNEAPPLARIDSIERQPLPLEVRDDAAPRAFSIAGSEAGEVRTAVVPDAACCAACLEESLDPASRRYRYAFTNCTHCGPRFSIVAAIPYDRANTSMARFGLCTDCEREYHDPADRRFHAQPTACPACGPRVWLEDSASQEGGDSNGCGVTSGDAIDAAVAQLQHGAIVAIKGLGGFHLACDATDAAAVERLRARKQRDRKPFALMAPGVADVERYCHVGDEERRLLQSAAAPIVLLRRRDGVLPEAIAPGMQTLGFMLPYTPLHHLLARAMQRPLVMTSGNRSDEPQCIDDADARKRLSGIADAFLLHDRAIVNRIDDSVVRVVDAQPRVLRRARGYAPAPLPLPEGFASAPPLVALGATLKNTFCLTGDGQALLSQHQGDLDDALAFEDARRSLALYQSMFAHRPTGVAVDRHPDYLSSKLGVAWAERDGLALEFVQHHHAHIASCMAENGWPLAGGPVLGIALDGLGMGEGGELWGGEFLLCDYASSRRVARFEPVALPGGEKAVEQPWRSAYAHLVAAVGADTLQRRYGNLELVRFLAAQPLALLQAMLARGINCPPASSCGRLFDAVAAAVGICREAIAYEGQAAIELEALAGVATEGTTAGYAFAVAETPGGIRTLDAAPMWGALLDDLAAGLAPSIIAARFHRGLASAVAALAMRCARDHGTTTLALSGGVFHNRILMEAVSHQLAAAGLRVLTHRQVPAGDGGLALGQAAVAAARFIKRGERRCA